MVSPAQRLLVVTICSLSRAPFGSYIWTKRFADLYPFDEVFTTVPTICPFWMLNPDARSPYLVSASLGVTHGCASMASLQDSKAEVKTVRITTLRRRIFHLRIRF